jgi:cyclohexyl-isocyanide hydratase
MLPTSIPTFLADYDVLIVPGGVGTRTLIHNQHFIEWIRTAQTVPLKVSICTGSLILGAADFLKDKAATTHFSEYDTLQPFCREVSKDRIVEDGNVITAGAVSASIDLGLYLCEKWAGPEAARDIRRRMNYQGLHTI